MVSVLVFATMDNDMVVVVEASVVVAWVGVALTKEGLVVVVGVTTAIELGAPVPGFADVFANVVIGASMLALTTGTIG